MSSKFKWQRICFKYYGFEEPRFDSYINLDDSIDAYEEQIISMTNGHKKNLVPHETLCLSKLR